MPRNKIYIAYRRNGGSELASFVASKLSSLSQRKKKKLDIFFDIKTLEAGRFDLALHENLEGSNHFVLILTPGALDRCIESETNDSSEDWVRKEIAIALTKNLNIIPIIHPEFKWPADEDLPEDIRDISRYNGIPWHHYFQEAVINEIEKFIDGVNSKCEEARHDAAIRQIMLHQMIHQRMNMFI